jgi:hypothetical protein
MFRISFVQTLFTITILAMASFLISGCDPKNKGSDGHADHGHDHLEGKHGGFVVTVGKDFLHVELVHDGKKGKVKAYVTGKDAKAAMAIAEAPVLVLKSKEGTQRLEMKATAATDGKSAEFEAESEELKDGPNGMPNLLEPLQGRLTLKHDEKTYNQDFKEEAHDH